MGPPSLLGWFRSGDKRMKGGRVNAWAVAGGENTLERRKLKRGSGFDWP
ncbi:MAG: hypothetical protein ACI9WU_002983 [Myxococcota bacterium]|jgi:hypothetical protein